MQKRINLNRPNSNFLEETAKSEIYRRLWMWREESLCLMRKWLETFRPSFKTKSKKPDKTIRIILLYKEKVNWLLVKWKESRLKWKGKEDKLWPKRSSLIRNSSKWKTKTSNSDNRVKANKVKSRNTEPMLRIYRKREKTSKELFNK